MECVHEREQQIAAKLPAGKALRECLNQGPGFRRLLNELFGVVRRSSKLDFEECSV